MQNCYGLSSIGEVETGELERAMRFELTTLTLARLCSTPELRPHPFRDAVYNECAAQRARGKCTDITKKFDGGLTCLA